MIVLTESTREKVLLAAQVRAAQRGDQQAFGQLVERFQRAVYGVALRRLRNHAEAQELVQEVFVQAMRKIGQLREPECFGGWLRSITAGWLSTAQCAAGRWCRPIAKRSRPPASSGTPLAAALERERASQVRAGLRRLPHLGPENIEAFYVRGQSLIEMSDEFGSPIGTIKRRLHVARKRLAHELQELAPA